MPILDQDATLSLILISIITSGIWNPVTKRLWIGRALPETQVYTQAWISFIRNPDCATQSNYAQEGILFAGDEQLKPTPEAQLVVDNLPIDFWRSDDTDCKELVRDAWFACYEGAPDKNVNVLRIKTHYQIFEEPSSSEGELDVNVPDKKTLATKSSRKRKANDLD